MAKSFTTTDGVVVIPGGYPKYRVQTAPGGLATTGVLMLVGEADSGPAFSAEEDLEDNAFGPDQLAEVVAKYGSGQLVDAFRGAIAASNDPDITGSFSRAILVKTNVGTKASLAVTERVTAGAWSTVKAKLEGTPGNTLRVGVSVATAEAGYTIPAFSYFPPNDSTYTMHVMSGGARTVVTITGSTTHANLLSALNAITGVSATGGTARTASWIGTTITSFDGTTILHDGDDFGVQVGDTLLITASAPATLRDPAGGVAVDPNVGAYRVDATATGSVTVTKMTDFGNVSGANTYNIGVTAPEATVASTLLAGGHILAYAPITLAMDLTDLYAYGRSLEVANLSPDAPSGIQLENLFQTVTGAASSTWISTALSPKLLLPTAEPRHTVTVTSQSATENWTAGGEIALSIGRTDTAVGTVTVTDTTLTLTSGTSTIIALADYPLIKDLVDKINNVAGWAASATNASVGLLPSTVLDQVSAQAQIAFAASGLKPARLKMDAYKMFKAISEGSQLIQVGDPATRPTAGLPAVTATTYLSGGARGSTASISSALEALEHVQGNFLVPLFSRDATDDATDGVTDAGSTYTISAINAACKTHVLTMSQFKRRRNRQTLVSLQDAFADQQNAAADMASFRANMAFQNVKDLDSAGDIVTFQPWMGAVKAASMQAAGFYRSITKKLVNISGLTHDAGDFNAKNDSHMENALLSGLMPIRPARTGGWEWVSDQTTYGADDNFVFNSLQAVYAADTIALTTGQRMEDAFVGQSVADVSAQVAMTYLDQIMADFLRLKLIAPSDDAPKGYKNARIRISGNSMLVSVEIKLATAIDFIVIDFLVSPVQQTA